MLTDQEKKALKLQIQSNQHEVFVISIEEMDAIIKSSPKGKMPSVQQAWQQIKGKVEFGASYYGSADDFITLSKLVGDLGGFTTQAYIKTYGGKPHIILKGYPGLRKILTGTKYGIKHPKVITMGLGRAGAINAARSGGILSVVLMSAYRVVDYFLTDQATLSRLIGSLATDVVKIGIATGASIAAAYGVVALGITVAIGPILAVVIVGIASSYELGKIDTRYGITDRVIQALDELDENANAYIARSRQNIRNTVNETAESIIDYAIDSVRQIIINAAQHQLDKFLSTRPRIY
ncbi:MAG: hypothetical protein M8364_14010 [Methylobacter sp.]|uniref:hypothetical protein n=1 Tax=Methylobacter sp. TaxID=2051955 RepID=UPI0025893E3D|nr:hypothetical protein [Methylobacter sp.]MCL7422010.1 hypothetical protein [Methylobacter sp.]